MWAKKGHPRTPAASKLISVLALTMWQNVALRLLRGRSVQGLLCHKYIAKVLFLFNALKRRKDKAQKPSSPFVERQCSPRVSAYVDCVVKLTQCDVSTGTFGMTCHTRPATLFITATSQLPSFPVH